ncbi:MAG: ATP-binding protein [Candidatus Binatia bacterium]
MSGPAPEGRIFILLRYVLIIAAAYLFLFEGETAAPSPLLVLIAAALLSNVFLASVPESVLLRHLTLGLVVCVDIVWIGSGLWYKGNFGSDIFFLYFFVLFLAALGQNMLFTACVSVLLAGVDVLLFVPASGEGQSIWTSSSLIRIPFMFIAALFYGYMAQRIRQEKEMGQQRIHSLREIGSAITSTLDLRGILEILLEKIDRFLPYAAVSVDLFNKTNGLLEREACRNLDEKEWKAEKAKGASGLADVVFETKAPWVVHNLQSDPGTAKADFFRKQGLVSYLGVPLVAKGETLGVLSFYTKDEHEFAGQETEFLATLAGQAAIAIHNSQLYEEAIRANKVKEEFLGIMSHELRTPLNVITGYAGILKDKLYGEINAQQEAALEKMMDRAADLLTMINRILNASSVEAQAVKVELNTVDILSFFNQLKANYDIPRKDGIVLRWEYDPQLTEIKTDGEKLRHIVQNLINNAIKFTDKGRVTISARCLQDGKKVEFRVTDTGIGIPQEFLPVVFEKFHQVDGSRRRLYGGVGIGLYIVKEFTRLLGGEITVESELGKGSTFAVILPTDS